MSVGSNKQPAPSAIPDENEQIVVRKQKLAALRQQQKTAFPNGFKRDTVATDLHKKYGHQSKEALAQFSDTFKLAGRIMLRRIMGKASFMTIQDMSGRIQIYVRKDALAADVYEAFKHWDLGDIVAVEGTVFKTNTGELSLHATQIQLLTKALRPLPDKFHGLADLEQRYRQRYLDLMMNEKTRKVFQIRSQVVAFIRDYLTDKAFIEVETPMMQTLAGGAMARPFKTYHHALEREMFLRIAPELFLKRLIVGGLERVFEINRNFRNEGLSSRHNPEFTMLEFYQAYADYNDLINLTEDMMRKLCQAIHGQDQLSYQGDNIDFSGQFHRMSVKQAILHYNADIQPDELAERETAATIAQRLDISVQPQFGLGKILIEIFEKTAEHRLIQPTFITEYPAEVSPLARRNDDDPFVTDRFEFFVGGRELANGFSELNDPEDQAMRFREQVAARAAGDDEAMVYDADYITALEHGMPPTAGEGIGIDRLVMLLTDAASIRDVLLFPHMRPLATSDTQM